jgi:hypothetical protein
MIILDTNVLPEMMRPSPSEAVASWLAAINPQTLYTTATTEGEILAGLEMLPRRRRRAELDAGVARLFSGPLAGRVLPFDSDAARLFGVLMASRRSSGCPISFPDAHRCDLLISRGSTCHAQHPQF